MLRGLAGKDGIQGTATQYSSSFCNKNHVCSQLLHANADLTLSSVCIATGIELKYYQEYSASNDRTCTFAMIIDSALTLNSLPGSNINSTIWEQISINLSIIFTAVPSIGRLLVELQPAVNAFAITELHGARSHDKWVLSSLAGRFKQDFVADNRLGVNTSILGSRGTKTSKRIRDSIRKQEEGESVKGLREGVIHQTMDVRMY